MEFFDWNTLTLDQHCEILEDKYRFSSAGEAKSIFELIKFYRDTKVKNLVQPDVSGQFSFAKEAFEAARQKKGNAFSKYTPPRITNKYETFEDWIKAKENLR